MPATSRRVDGDPPLYFDYRTALQLLRMVDVGALAPARNSARLLPDRAPGKSKVEAVIERLELSYPGLRIERPAHLLVGGSARGRASDAFKLHVCTPCLWGTSFYRLGEGIFVSAPPLAFVHEATRGASETALLELGYELCGTYQSKRTGVPTRYGVKPLTSVRALGDYVAHNPSINGARKVARIMRYLADGSASSRETKQALALGLPMSRGGYGLGIPHMNYEVAASGAARAISGKSCFRCDLCWPERKLDVEYQSKECHEGEASRITDSRRANALMTMGWTVVGVTNDELDSFAATETIACTIRRHLGKRSQVRIPDYHARKLRLRRQLGLSMGFD